ncbi:hypothetical protein GCM10012275_14140 [Longimycelium tulufanense]|uniref:DUF2304 domain-containing protein n=1 Tax=Longimycelium tulufanense TaxID=907463 RepID=A0A8J3C6X6_9PSEU|nr:DUF2304 domain-containing protein [Longimycelium tulufanense]GGM44293.1 hypothetical protein GCM10012275_14140 [Longimycelium tulufanense]
MPGWRLLSVIVAIAVLVIVVEMMRRRKLREKYAGAWLLVGLGVVIFGVFPGVAEALARATGILTAANLVFLLSGLVLLVVSLQLSSEIGHLEEEVRTSVEEIALLRCELDETRRRLEEQIGEIAARTNGPHAPNETPAGLENGVTPARR